MPYFRRCSFAEMLQPPSSIGSLNPALMAEAFSGAQGDLSGVVERARAILREHSSDLPTSAVPFSLPGSDLFQQAVNTFGKSQASPSPASSASVFEAGTRAIPGQRVEFSLALQNDDTGPASCEVHVSEFISDSGSRISSSLIAVSISSRTIAGHSAANLTIVVDVPGTAPVGRYCATLMIAGAESEPVVLDLRVLED